jgi:hypothetical protein
MLAVEIDLEIEGDVSEEWINQRMKILGELIINRVKKNIRDMNLISEGGGQYLQGWLSKFDNGVLIIENTQKYSDYLEYGTYAYWNKNQLTGYTDPPDPKKKHLTNKDKKLFPKGMQSFAPLRKVMFNEKIMEELLTEAFSD